MIDWLSFSVPYEGPSIHEQFYREDLASGDLLPAYTKGVFVEGSWSSKLLAQSKERRLYISANPAKFLTGQNVVGTDDAWLLVGELVEAVFRHMGYAGCELARANIEAGRVRFTRVDCTYHYRVGTDDDVTTWLRCLEDACHVRHRGKGQFDPGMCAIRFGVGAGDNGRQKASRRSTFKFYNKLRELIRHPLEVDAKWLCPLTKMAEGVVRGEACYRGLELKDKGVQELAKWTDDTAWKLHREWIGKMEISANVELLNNREAELPARLRSVHRLWACGQDVRALLSRATFYRHRRDLLAYGVDIGLPRAPQDERRRVVPMLSVLEAEPVDRAEGERVFRELLGERCGLDRAA